MKIRGYRIEIGEIESTLRRCHGVGQAAVVVREDQPAVRQLVGYVVPDTGGTSLDVSAIRDQLAGWLPDYMVPSVVMEVGVLPLTTNGKLDAEALPKPGDVPRADMVVAENDAEQQIMDLFAEVLGIGEVSATDSFFALGGDSITAIQLVNRARSKGVALKANEVFAHPNPRDLARDAKSIDLCESNNEDIEFISVSEKHHIQSDFNKPSDILPLTPLQQGLLFHSLLGQDEERAPYVSQLVLELGGGLDIERIERAYSRLIERHEALRVRFSHRESGEPIQVVLSSDAPVFIAHDESERNDIWSQVREREGVAFDLENSPLIECHVYPIMGGGSFLVLRMHHLILDGWSMPLLLDDLLSLYSGDSRPVSSEVRLRDFYEWLARSGSENSVSTWTGVLGDTVEPTLVAPEAGPDRPHLHVSQSFDLGSALTREVERLARDLSTTVNSVLESSWGDGSRRTNRI
ncbi:condensation domain-containing protein [Kocuria sp. SL71]|uniref:condensation domain-containing protein n=1 Tax=Kocuria sp. SL71 TaxID=2995151 RepID=UPI00227353AE|nr:condensation domain-containing protein [Kocuria sp. SL71]MCY1684003.1 condensation domain-containing protein [Kocuria sp. SL71]